MRTIAAILILLLAICGRVSAIGWQPVDCDSTSYLYCVQAMAGDTLRQPYAPYWEALVSLPVDEPKADEAAAVEPGAGEGAESVSPSARERKNLFTLPADLLASQNPEYQTVRRDKQEYYVRLRKDNTTPIYTCRNVDKLTLRDSLTMFLPFDTRNLNDYTVKQFGIKAKYVEIKNPLPPHFHIDIDDSPIREHYPWMVILPVVLGVALVLMALFFQGGYVRRIFNVVFYHNVFMHRVRERNVNADKSGALLFVNYIVNAAIFATVVLYRYDYQFSASFFVAFLSLLVLVLLVYAVKAAISYAMAHLFSCRDVYQLYYSNISYIMQAGGVFLLVMNILNLYVNRQGLHDFFFYATLSGCAVGEIMKIFRLFKIIFDKHFSYFYLFLYLCAVEFLPVLLVVKYLSL